MVYPLCPRKLLPLSVLLLLLIVLLISSYRSRQETFLYNGYCVHSNIQQSFSFQDYPTEVTERDRITQVIHVSDRQLDERIAEQVENWNAPVSLAVVLSSPQDYACVRAKIHLFRDKSPAVRRHLQLHLVFPSTWASNCREPNRLSLACPRIRPVLKELTDYPVNVARRFSRTEYILMTEYGDLFSQNFEQDVLKIAKKHLTNHKKVLVYRKFEVNMGEKQPKTKKELKELLDRKMAIVRKGDDEIDGLNKWLDGKQTSVSHLNYTKHTWEPRSVSRNDIPLHDVDFPFLLHDNTALTWEMCRAGYRWDLLGEHFMYRMETKEDDDEKTRAIEEMNRERFTKALEMFKKRMEEEYPGTGKTCPKIISL